MTGVTRDDRPCPHCDGANTGYVSAGKYEMYTTHERLTDGARVFACCDANREQCPNFRAVQVLRARLGGAP